MRKRIVLFGATGFVGDAVRTALSADHDVIGVVAPRLSTQARDCGSLLAEARGLELPADTANALSGADVVINAAGDPDASSLDEGRLYGANALLPALVLEHARRAGVRRLVHVSSAVVQNDKPLLDDSEEMSGFSPYSFSKILGEQVLRAAGATGIDVVRYRPPSVHAAGRRVTRMVAKIAKSPLATVAHPGDQPTPQALLPNVASAIACLATSDERPPPVVHHPTEGVTVSSLMIDLGGGRPPRRIPRWMAKRLVALAKLAGRLHRPTAANARRVELLWLGQEQSESWLSRIGWRPPVDRAGWKALGEGTPGP